MPLLVPSDAPTITPSSIPSSAWLTTTSPSSDSPTTESPLTTRSPSTALSPSTTLSPSTIYVLTANAPLHVPHYSTSDSSSATVNTVPYTFTSCSVGVIHIADCDPDRCDNRQSDQYIRLYTNGEEVAFNDDTCSLCSVIDYPIESDTCLIYILQQGCFGVNKCSGNFTISLTSFPTPTPTSVPNPQSPTTNQVITVDMPLPVPYYSAVLTGSAYYNTVPFTFTACFAGVIHIADCDAARCNSGSNDQLIRLYSEGREIASNDDFCDYCSVIDYFSYFDTCQTYTLQQGCYNNKECVGKFTITLMSFDPFAGKLFSFVIVMYI